MTHTALGLFRNATDADIVVTELKAAGFSAGDVRIAAEPRYMPVSSPLSTPGMDFCEDLALNLRAIGVPEPVTQAYIQGVRDGGSLLFASGSAEQVEKAVEIMNHHPVVTVEELKALQLDIRELPHEKAIAHEVSTGQAGRVRYAGSGARMFAW